MDLIQRLRTKPPTYEDAIAAADEIERLRKELQNFREANMLLNSMIETEHKIIKTKGE